jgi:hypothetical protein
MTVVQFTRFRVTPEREQAVLDARLAALRACRGAEPELHAAYLIRLADGDWLDIAVWAGQPVAEAFDDPARPASRGTFFAHIDELLGEECGTLVLPGPDGSLGPDPGVWFLRPGDTRWCFTGP